MHSQELTWKALEVFNLEEDKGPFATMNDEIVVWISKINTQKDWIMSWEHTDEMVFSDSVSKHSLTNLQQVQIDSYDLVFITLIEMDNKHIPDSLDIKLKQVFMAYYAFPLTLLKDNIRLKLEDDDLLGIDVLKFEDKQLQDGKINFKGMHLFNRYEYEVYFEGSEP